MALSILIKKSNPITKVQDTFYTLFQEKVDRASECYKQARSILKPSEREAARIDRNSTLENILIYGKVQSGKTHYLTCISAVARDLGFQIIINLTGRDWNLLGQCEERFKRDLGGRNESSDEGWGLSHWDFYIAKKQGSRLPSDHSEVLTQPGLTASLNANKTVMVFALKNKTHMGHLRKLIANYQTNGRQLRLLIIDDESDQLSTNNYSNKNLDEFNLTKVRSKGQLDRVRETPTYASLRELKCVSDHTTFVQSTATPQCNILAAEYCLLRPTFIKVIDPGKHYYGGSFYFGTNAEGANHVVRIPAIEKKKRKKDSTETIEPDPYPCIDAAIHYYLLSCFQHIYDHIKLNMPLENRSMMFHPSVKKTDHKRTKEHVDELIDRFLLSVDENDLTLMRSFWLGWKKISRSQLKLSELIEPEILKIFRQNCRTRVLNQSTSRDTINWEEHKFQIFFGGFLLDRGFTIKNLIVSYLVRGTSRVSNAPSVQQWGRFFGYRETYHQYCYIFLDENVAKVFDDYVSHETDLRESLKEAEKLGVEEWHLKLMITPTAQTVRPSCIGKKLKELGELEEWATPNNLHFAGYPKPLLKIRNNTKIFNSLKELLNQCQSKISLETLNQLRQELGQPRYQETKKETNDDYFYLESKEHLEAFRGLIENLSYSDESLKIRYMTAILRVMNLKETPSPIFIAGMKGAFRDNPGSSRRTLGKNQEISLFSGAGTRRSPERELYIKNTLTFHFRYIDLKHSDYENTPIPWFTMRGGENHGFLVEET